MLYIGEFMLYVVKYLLKSGKTSQKVLEAESFSAVASMAKKEIKGLQQISSVSMKD